MHSLMSWSPTKKDLKQDIKIPQNHMQRNLMSINDILKEMLDLLVVSKDA